jgi:hypothetical protein
MGDALACGEMSRDVPSLIELFADAEDGGRRYLKNEKNGGFGPSRGKICT